MEFIIKFIDGIGELLCLITPFTLIWGLVNAIRRPKSEYKIYLVIAIISAYLIFIPIIFNWM
ncbi:hypothetical protein [Aminipila sp.]|uniref:hypothetical protein n=1 Tax=Aminipila sp. TaxID=2060095 RepID=UPI00289D73F6|nr:hypothetical protein [Aminipila sp.]